MRIHKKIFHKLPPELQAYIKRLVRPENSMPAPTAPEPGEIPSPEPVEYGCINCGSDEYEPVYPQFGIARCKNCNLIYSRRRKSDEYLKNYYSKIYLEAAEAGNYVDVGVPAEVVKKFLKDNDSSYFLNIAKEHECVFDQYILPYLPKSDGSGEVRHILEVGCAWGAVLLAAKSKGLKASGYEISRPNCELAQKLGLDVHNSEFSAADIPDDSVDAILFSHSLEHITTPNKYLARAYAALKSGGVLVVFVPNFNSYWHLRALGNWSWLDPVGHVAAYTGASLCAIIKSAGFKIVSCFTECSLGYIQEYVQQEVGPKGCPLSEPEVEEFIRKLNDAHMGESLCVIARKE